MEEMDALLRSLAIQNPPGPMADQTSTSPITSTRTTNQGEEPLSPEEEEKAWQKAVEMMMSGEGLAALGLDENASSSTSSAAPVASGSNPTSATAGSNKADPPSFEETMRKTMESLKAGGENKGAGGTGAAPPDLAALLAQLGEGGLEGLGEGDDDLGGLLDGMMSQLMTKEVLEEPMTELASKVGTMGIATCG
jgi:peroxin-19